MKKKGKGGIGSGGTPIFNELHKEREISTPRMGGMLFWASVIATAAFFFFSSRRRHTISLRDWSSDVCSSDLAPGNHPDVRHLAKIWHPHAFYRDLRHLVFSEQRPDPDDVGTNGLPEDATAPLPRIDAPSLRKR